MLASWWLAFGRSGHRLQAIKTTKLKSLANAAVLLPPEDRTYLAEQLLASLEEADLEEQWAAEARRRRDEVRSGHVKPIPTEEVYRRIEQLLTK